jgi:hypothetical protein
MDMSEDRTKEFFQAVGFGLCGITFLGAFTKLQKATISFVMSVCPHGTQLPLDGF